MTWLKVSSDSMGSLENLLYIFSWELRWEVVPVVCICGGLALPGSQTSIQLLITPHLPGEMADWKEGGGTGVERLKSENEERENTCQLLSWAKQA